MRRIDGTAAMQVIVFVALLVVLAPPPAWPATIDRTLSDSGVWDRYTEREKEKLLWGFADCYRVETSEKKAFIWANDEAAAHIVDEGVKRGAASLPLLLLDALRKAPVMSDDPHAEHWAGPTGFRDGLWWREINDGKRQAYIQGALWCEGELKRVVPPSSADVVKSAVATLNSWYVIDDENWKDPRSNARVDISVMSALKRSGALKAVEGGGPALRLSPH